MLKQIDKLVENLSHIERKQFALFQSSFFTNWVELLRNPINIIDMLITKASEFEKPDIGDAGRKLKKIEIVGRLRTINKLKLKNKFTASIGAKSTKFADINIDIDKSVNPDIVSDARYLPFKSNVFEQILFTDVIEHLPKKNEIDALREICRILKTDGTLVLSTPNHRLSYTYLDPAYYIIKHRHYKIYEIKELLELSGFKIVNLFTAGNYWACVTNLWYSFITYPLVKIFRLEVGYVPSVLVSLEDRGYENIEDRGYTIFAQAVKK